MSSSEQIFFDSATTAQAEIAPMIARALAADLREDDARGTLMMEVSDPPDAWLVGWIEDNDYVAEPGSSSTPKDRSVFDEMPTVIRLVLSIKDDDIQQRAARAVFDRLAMSDLRWPLVLTRPVHGVSTVWSLFLRKSASTTQSR